MKKYAQRSVFSVLLAILMALILPCTSLAADPAPGSAAGTPRFTDEMNLLTEREAAALTSRLDEVSERHGFDVAVAVVNSTGGKDPRVYAADYFESNGYGLGADKEGIILLIAMERRDFAFVTTSGYGTYAFTYAGQEYLESLFLPYLSDNDYNKAFMAFADAADDFLTRAGKGQPYDRGNIPRLTDAERNSARIWTIVGSLVLGVIVAAIVTGIWTTQLKSVRRQDYAQNYIRQGSMALRVQRDIFLYRNVKRTKRQQNNSSGGGSRGGSFKSSSGRSFSGRSGRF